MNNESDDDERPKEIELIINAEEEKDEKLQEFANKHDVVLLAFIGSYVPRRYNPVSFRRSTMNITDEFGIETILTDLKKKIPTLKNKKVFLLVNSIGGSVSSAYKTARAIRESFEDITVFIPHYALSGGTMMALVGNKIVMGIMSQLSPLDVQLPYNSQQVSVNSLFRAKERFDRDFSTKRPEEIPYPDKYLAERLDPIILEEWVGFQKEVICYLEDILVKSRYNEKERGNLIHKLVFEFPIHGYVIHRDHAKELGIKVEFNEENNEAWKQMRNWLLRYIVQQTDQHFIRYVIPNTAKKDNKNTKEVKPKNNKLMKTKK